MTIQGMLSFPDVLGPGSLSELGLVYELQMSSLPVANRCQFAKRLQTAVLPAGCVRRYNASIRHLYFIGLYRRRKASGSCEGRGKNTACRMADEGKIDEMSENTSSPIPARCCDLRQYQCRQPTDPR